ncbi:MAG: AMP-binding protein, partial [Burkholderiales bacterium]
HAYLHQSRRVAAISGIRDTDMIANLFPLNAAPMGAFVRSATNAYAAGAAIFAALPGAPHGDFNVHRTLDDAVAMIERHRATILWGVLSFLRRVLDRAIERGADFGAVRMCALSGEASSPALVQALRALMRTLGTAGQIVFDRYGSTEIGAFAQCQEDGHWHNPAPEIQYHEIVDPETGGRLPDGERGALAVTHLDRRGTVLVRFLVGDQVSLVRGPCPHCGRTGDRVVGPVVRTKDLVKVKGMLINPAALAQAIGQVPGIDEYQFVVRKADPRDPLSMDELALRIATRVPDREALTVRVVQATREIAQVRPVIEFVEAIDIFNPAGQTKAIRFTDQRTP